MASPPRHAAVLGRPIAHSLSPVLHRAAYVALGLSWSYDAIDCAPDDLAALLAERRGWAGFSCTMPLKHAALAVADEASPAATAIGAANTLLPAGGGWRAENTDVTGILSALAERSVRPETATVLGAGGTAQAAVAAFAQLGITSCGVLVRDVARTTNLAVTAERLGVQLAVSRLAPDASELDADLIVSTLPGDSALAVADHAWRPDQAVLDVVYDPWPTALATCAGRGGSTFVSGALMLLHQAAAQVELMTGLPAPVEAMRAALRAAVPDGW
ncbi:MAG TPA: shikimate dehydrogenase [Jatrophihabitantaceae bacterium]|nr:shikimate dehydrogenase [Jatrophihabitantaceae bacterium]